MSRGEMELMENYAPGVGRAEGPDSLGKLQRNKD